MEKRWLSLVPQWKNRTLHRRIREGKRQKPIVLHVSGIPQGKIKEIEFCYDHEAYLAVVYEDGIATNPIRLSK